MELDDDWIIEKEDPCLLDHVLWMNIFTPKERAPSKKKNSGICLNF